MTLFLAKVTERMDVQKEQWSDIEGFPGYAIGSFGNVLNEATGRLMLPTPNQQGILTIGLVKDKKQYRKSLTLLVAKAFVEPELPHFDTPIHLDGDRSNCRADNIMWRPRWFAIRFHKERVEDPFPNWHSPIELANTGEIFATPRDCGMKYGLLERDIHHSLTNNTPVFPHWYHFQLA